MIYGYARVSSTDQNLDRQLMSFRKENIPEQNIYYDKQSGKDFCRDNYIHLRKKLRRNDLLIIPSIDRLGRDYEMILGEWTYITKKIRADIRVLDMPLLDTSKSNGSLTGRFIADIVLQILCYVAQKERENILIRQREGIDAAKERGVKFGRPPLPTPEDATDIYKKYIDGIITAEFAAALLRVSTTTLYRRVKENFDLKILRRGRPLKA